MLWWLGPKVFWFSLEKKQHFKLMPIGLNLSSYARKTKHLLEMVKCYIIELKLHLMSKKSESISNWGSRSQFLSQANLQNVTTAYDEIFFEIIKNLTNID